MGIRTSSDEFGTEEGDETTPEAESSGFDVFHRPATEVRARRLDERVVVETDAGVIVGEPGDWLLEEPDGTRRLCEDERFRETYRGATVAANKTLEEADPSE